MLPDTPPDFSGFITAVDPTARGEVLATLVVESHAEKIVRRRLVRITRRSTLLERRDGSERPLELDSLRTRDRVQVWFAQPFDEPPPAAAEARQLTVMRGAG